MGEVEAAPLGRPASHVEEVAGVLADRFEQPVPRAPVEFDGDERRAHELVEQLVAVVRRVDTDAPEGRGVAPAGEHAHRRQGVPSRRREQVEPPVERRVIYAVFPFIPLGCMSVVCIFQNGTQ